MIWAETGCLLLKSRQGCLLGLRFKMGRHHLLVIARVDVFERQHVIDVVKVLPNFEDTFVVHGLIFLQIDQEEWAGINVVYFLEVNFCSCVKP